MRLATGLLIGMFLGMSAYGETWTVDDDGKADFDNIQAAINAASDGDEIIVAPGTYTYTPGSGDDVEDPVVDTLGKAIYLHSSGGLEKTILDGVGDRRVVLCRSGETAETVIEGFTMTGGQDYSGGGIRCDDSNPTLSNCLITGNMAVHYGGGIVLNNGSPTLTNCTVSGNTTWGGSETFGGGIYMEVSFPTLTDCVISDNTCDGYEWWIPNAGGIYSLFSNPTLIDTLVCGNNRDQIHGAWTDGGNTCVATSCDDGDGDGVPDTCQGTNGDGIHEVPSEYATVQAAIEAAGDGDLVLVSPGIYRGAPTASAVINPRGKRINIRSTDGLEVTILDGENVRRVLQCTSHETDETVIEGFTMTGGNSGTGFDWDGAPGGGVLCRHSAPTLIDCTISGNISPKYGGGGGIALSYDGHITMTGCTISNNFAAVGGGIICGDQSSYKLTDCTISDNEAFAGGSEIWQTGGVGEMNGCTISGSSNPGWPLIECNGAGQVHGHLTLTDCTIWDGPLRVAGGSSVSFAGTSTCEGIIWDGADTVLALAAESVCAVPADLMPSSEAVTMFDLDNLDTSASLLAGGEMVRQGCLAVTNETGSLAEAEVGMILPLVQTDELGGEFDSIVFPQMPDGLGLQVITQSTIRGGGSQIALEVIEVEGAQFDDPLSGDLNSAPIDIIEFDADGDGADEIAVLFAGTPGVVAAFQVSEDGAPTPIEGLAAYVGNNPVDLDAGDLNGDGLDDLLVANSTDNTVSVLLTTGGGQEPQSFDVFTLGVPGSGQSLSCVAAIDWDSNTGLDAVVGVDLGNNNNDGYRVLLDVASGSPNAGPWLEVPSYPQTPPSAPDPPTSVDGGDQTAAFGFVGGTRCGRIHHAENGAGLQLLGALSGTNITVIEAVNMDNGVGDGQLDLMVASDEAESIYLFQGDQGEADGFGDLIPLDVGVAVEDVVAIDADRDGDTDMVLAAPSSDTPLLLLRNDGVVGLLDEPLGGRTWSKQAMGSGGSVNQLASGDVDPGDVGDTKDLDDWVTGTAPLEGLRGEVAGTMEQTNLFGRAAGCNADLDGSGTVGVGDLLIVIDQWGACERCSADLNEDGVVGVVDLLEVIGTWGPCP